MDNEFRILNHLAKHYAETFTLRELSNTLKIPYATFYRTIQAMQDLISVESKGNSKLITLSWNEITPSYLAIASYENCKEFLDKNLLIKKIAENAVPITVLFGSYAKGMQTERSDIDLLIITPTGKTTASFASDELLFKKKINPIIVTPEEFKEMLNDKEETVGKQALKDHILLSGADDFWRLVHDAVR